MDKPTLYGDRGTNHLSGLEIIMRTGLLLLLVTS